MSETKSFVIYFTFLFCFLFFVKLATGGYSSDEVEFDEDSSFMSIEDFEKSCNGAGGEVKYRIRNDSLWLDILECKS